MIVSGYFCCEMGTTNALLLSQGRRGTRKTNQLKQSPWTQMWMKLSCSLIENKKTFLFISKHPFQFLYTLFSKLYLVGYGFSIGFGHVKHKSSYAHYCTDLKVMFVHVLFSWILKHG
ncbi:hypothetical protein Lal_00038403 [Lupinus albus]|nr:hypothetical protein Lal_00038403 [Lupinus albus]